MTASTHLAAGWTCLLANPHTHDVPAHRECQPTHRPFRLQRLKSKRDEQSTVPGAGPDKYQEDSFRRVPIAVAQLCCHTWPKAGASTGGCWT
jgi:hypothetical protein